MPTSTFHTVKMQSIDYMNPPDGSSAEAIDVGLLYLGGSKTLQRRALLDFDIYGNAYEGRAMTPSDNIISATLALYITGVNGPTAWDCLLERNSRPSWADGAAVNWTYYNNPAAWTTSGGDVATPPAAVTFQSPSTISYDLPIACLDVVLDAIALRSGYVCVRIRKADEAVATTHIWNARPRSAGNNPTQEPRLIISYTSAEPRPMDYPADASTGSARATRPTAASTPTPPARPTRQRVGR